MFREPVHQVLRKGGRYLSFDQPPDEPAPHQCAAVLGSAAHHLQHQPAQRHLAQVRQNLLEPLTLLKHRSTENVKMESKCKKIKCLARRHLPKLPRLLESEDVNMRIAAGETIALLFELARDMDCVSLLLGLLVFYFLTLHSV